MTMQDQSKMRDRKPKQRDLRSERQRRRLRPEVLGLEDRLLLAGLGALDDSFGGSGVITVPLTAPNAPASLYQTATAVAIDGNANIVAAGWLTPTDELQYGESAATVARVLPTGTLDSSFNGNGMKLIYDGVNPQGDGYAQDSFSGIARDGAGNISFSNPSDRADPYLILVGGHQNNYDPSGPSPGSEFLLTRLDSQGNVDPSFGNQPTGSPDQGSEIIPSFGANSFDSATAALVQPNSTILVSGSSFTVSGESGELPLARLTSSGTLDPSFRNNGQSLLSIPGVDGNIDISAMGFQDGTSKIILAGTAQVDGTNEFLVVRLNTANDTIDNTFGPSQNGVVLIPFASDAYGVSMAIDPSSGRIIVAGYAAVSGGTSSAFALAALTAGGILDPTFGDQGTVTSNFQNGTDIGYAVALQPDGKIVVAGSATIGGQTDAALARYTSTGGLDKSFGLNPTGPQCPRPETRPDRDEHR